MVLHVGSFSPFVVVVSCCFMVPKNLTFLLGVKVSDAFYFIFYYINFSVSGL